MTPFHPFPSQPTSSLPWEATNIIRFSYNLTHESAYITEVHILLTAHSLSPLPTFDVVSHDFPELSRTPRPMCISFLYLVACRANAPDPYLLHLIYPEIIYIGT